MAKKTWQEKLHNGKSPVVGPSIRPACGKQVGTLMLVPTPMQVDAFIRKIPKGGSVTPEELGDKLAKENGAEITCPMCRGLFIRIVAEAAFEELSKGKEPAEVTPFWRVLPPGSPARKKLSFDPSIVDDLRSREASA